MVLMLFSLKLRRSELSVQLDRELETFYYTVQFFI